MHVSCLLVGVVLVFLIWMSLIPLCSALVQKKNVKATIMQLWTPWKLITTKQGWTQQQGRNIAQALHAPVQEAGVVDVMMVSNRIAQRMSTEFNYAAALEAIWTPTAHTDEILTKIIRDVLPTGRNKK